MLIACRLDLLLGATFIRDATIIAYCGNELLSITENIGLMGVPLPAIITQALEALRKKEEEKISCFAIFRFPHETRFSIKNFM